MSDTVPQPSASSVPTEAEALRSVLERNRRTFAWKTSGLDEKGLRATTAASSMTLGGLVKHMALVEADWLAVKLAGQEYGSPWDAVDFDADPDWNGVPARWTLRTRSTHCGEPRSNVRVSWLPRSSSSASHGPRGHPSRSRGRPGG